LVGDSVIADIARLVRQNIRMSDRLMRWGGEEFVVVLPGSNHEGAMARAEAIRAVIATHEFKAGEFLFRKSVSIGVVQWDGKESNDMLFARADHALLQSKQSGRNRVILADQGLL
jgi:diguanylate cyclase (GGDEF)-like protein